MHLRWCALVLAAAVLTAGGQALAQGPAAGLAAGALVRSATAPQTPVRAALSAAEITTIAVLPTVVRDTPYPAEAADLGQQIAHLLRREEDVRIVDDTLAAQFTLEDSAVAAGDVLHARFVLGTLVTGLYRADVLLRDGRTGAIVWGKTFHAYLDNLGALPAEVWVATMAVLHGMSEGP